MLSTQPFERPKAQIARAPAILMSRADPSETHLTATAVVTMLHR